MANEPDECAYPTHWKPAHIREAEAAAARREENSEAYLGELDDAGLDALIARIRPNYWRSPS